MTVERSDAASLSADDDRLEQLANGIREFLQSELVSDEMRESFLAHLAPQWFDYLAHRLVRNVDE